MSNFKLIPLESASTKGENTVLHTSSRILGFMQIKALQKLWNIGPPPTFVVEGRTNPNQAVCGGIIRNFITTMIDRGSVTQYCCNKQKYVNFIFCQSIIAKRF